MKTNQNHPGNLHPRAHFRMDKLDGPVVQSRGKYLRKADGYTIHPPDSGSVDVELYIQNSP